MKSALTGVCALVLLAVGYLSLSVVVLDPPRADFPLWAALAAVVTAESVLTLVALSTPGAPAAMRSVVVGGALALVAIGAWRVATMLARSHFEGYNLLLGAMLFVQAGLTIVVCGPRRTVRPIRP